MTRSLLFIITLDNELHPLNIIPRELAHPNLTSVSGNITLSMLAQSMKASSLTSLSLVCSNDKISFSFEHALKASDPINVNVDGKFTFVNLVHSWKDTYPIEVMPSGIVNSVIQRVAANAPSAIAVM